MSSFASRKSSSSSRIKAFLDYIAEQKRGFQFAPPERTSETSLAVVVPILRKTSLKRQYLLITESPETKVIDTGGISKMIAKNPTKENIFIRAGSIFRGETQERTLVRSVVVFAGKQAELEVRCVHASRPIRGGAETKTCGVTPYTVDQGNYGDGWKPKDQHTYWSNVATYSTKNLAPEISNHLHDGGTTECGINPDLLDMPIGHDQTTWQTTARPPSNVNVFSDMGGILRSYGQGPTPTSSAFSRGPKMDDLASTIDSVSSNLDSILKAVKCHDQQVGLALITPMGLQTVEVFDVEESWKAFHADAVKRVGSELAMQDEDVFEYKKERAHSTVAAALGESFMENVLYEHKPDNGEPPYRLIGLSSERFLGEVCELENRVIHLVLNRKPGK